MPIYNGVIYDKNRDYQADINAAVAKGDYKTAGEAEIRRNAKLAGEGITKYNPTYNYAGNANKSYGGRNYNNATDYSLLADSLYASGDLEGAKNAEKDANAKILGEGMNFSLRNKYGALDYEKDSKWSDKLDEILGAYEDAINSPGVSMPSYSAPSYSARYDAQIDELLNKLLNRDPFEYNEELDPLYQQYKDMYTKQGQLAMEDTMGQAAALTGGYSSTYSQAVGQQMYNAYLNKVQEMLPQFYDRAYGQYQDEGTNIKDLYGMYIQRDQVDFQRYQQEVANAQAEYEAAAAAARMAYGQQQDKIGNLGNLYDIISGAESSDYNRYLDQINRDWQMNETNYNRNQAKDETDYNRAQDAMKNARSEVDAILQLGGTPSADLISKAGYSAEYINSLRNYYAQQASSQSARSSGGSSGGSSKKKAAAEPTITNRNGNGWVYVPGLGRMTYYELESKVNSGEVKETKNKKANTITYSKKQ